MYLSKLKRQSICKLGSVEQWCCQLKCRYLIKKHPICSFYSVAPSSICRETLSVKMAKKWPRYPIPVFLLEQLAVHREFRGRGLGKISLIKTLEYLWEVNLL